jgi:hypothetical protein
MLNLGLLGASSFLASDYELISSTILISGTPSVTFSNLGTYASTYKHLQIRMSARTSIGAWVDNIAMRINSDTGANYSWHRFFAEGGNPRYVQNGLNSQQMRMLGISGSNISNNVFSAATTDITDSFSASKNKTIRTFGGHSEITGTSQINFGGGNWRNTSSISSITLFVESGNNFVSGSRFSIYGIKG